MVTSFFLIMLFFLLSSLHVGVEECIKKKPRNKFKLIQLTDFTCNKPSPLGCCCFDSLSRARVTLGTRGFSRVRREFSVLAEGRHVFGHRPKVRAETALEKSLAPRVGKSHRISYFFRRKCSLVSS